MPAPVRTLNIVVPPEWIDVNGHMNATHYGLVIYDAHFNFTREIGLGDEYVKATQCGKAVLESHMVFEREICLGDELEVVSWLLAVDSKRLHFFHELYNVSKNCRAAISEQVDIHIDINLRKSSPLPECLYIELQSRVKENLATDQPQGVGSRIKPPLNAWLNA
jgi:acyl-CoA thioester hydrolase